MIYLWSKWFPLESFICLEYEHETIRNGFVDDDCSEYLMEGSEHAFLL
jgi:hypothetical protein